MNYNTLFPLCIINTVNSSYNEALWISIFWCYKRCFVIIDKFSFIMEHSGQKTLRHNQIIRYIRLGYVTAQLVRVGPVMDATTSTGPIKASQVSRSLPYLLYIVGTKYCNSIADSFRKKIKVEM